MSANKSTAQRAKEKKEELQKNRTPKDKKKRLSLSMKDRLVIGTLFPRESDILTQILVRDIVEKTKIEQEEIERVGLTPAGNGFTWDKDKAKDIIIELTNPELKIMVDAVNNLDNTKKVTLDLLDLCMKIKDIE